jgi:hypothetical protein
MLKIIFKVKFAPIPCAPEKIATCGWPSAPAYSRQQFDFSAVRFWCRQGDQMSWRKKIAQNVAQPVFCRNQCGAQKCGLLM